LSVLILVVPGLLIHRGIVRRLRSVISITKARAKGDLSGQVEVKVHDEIGELGEAFNDMTARIQEIIQEIEQHKNFDEEILNNIDNGILVLDKGFRVVAANKSFTSRFSPEEAIGRHCSELHRHLFDCRDKCPAKITFLTGKPARDVHPHVKEDGRELVTEIFSTPLMDDQDQVRMVILVSKDITERLEMEKKLIRSDQMAIVGQMASGLAHELKNPLAGIGAAIQIIYQDMKENDPNREIFAEIQHQIMRMNRTLSDLLSFAKPRKPSLFECDINSLVTRSVTLIEPKAKSQGISIHLGLSRDLPSVRVDPDMIQQALLNMCLNAIQAQPDGGKIFIKTFSRNHGEDFVGIAVKDQGPGMSPEVLQKIFDPFFTTKHTGTGLGLTICEQIIEEHKGVLTVTSEEGKGTTCEVVLPVASDEQPTDQTPSPGVV